jgi:chromosome segregation protein
MQKINIKKILLFSFFLGDFCSLPNWGNQKNLFIGGVVFIYTGAMCYLFKSNNAQNKELNEQNKKIDEQKVEIDNLKAELNKSQQTIKEGVDAGIGQIKVVSKQQVEIVERFTQLNEQALPQIKTQLSEYENKLNSLNEKNKALSQSINQSNNTIKDLFTQFQLLKSESEGFLKAISLKIDDIKKQSEEIVANTEQETENMVQKSLDKKIETANEIMAKKTDDCIGKIKKESKKDSEEKLNKFKNDIDVFLNKQYELLKKRFEDLKKKYENPKNKKGAIFNGGSNEESNDSAGTYGWGG